MPFDPVLPERPAMAAEGIRVLHGSLPGRAACVRLAGRALLGADAAAVHRVHRRNGGADHRYFRYAAEEGSRKTRRGIRI